MGNRNSTGLSRKYGHHLIHFRAALQEKKRLRPASDRDAPGKRKLDFQRRVPTGLGEVFWVPPAHVQPGPRTPSFSPKCPHLPRPPLLPRAAVRWVPCPCGWRAGEGGARGPRAQGAQEGCRSTGWVPGGVTWRSAGARVAGPRLPLCFQRWLRQKRLPCDRPARVLDASRTAWRGHGAGEAGACARTARGRCALGPERPARLGTGATFSLRLWKRAW